VGQAFCTSVRSIAGSRNRYRAAASPPMSPHYCPHYFGPGTEAEVLDYWPMRNNWLALLLLSSSVSAQKAPLHLHFTADSNSFYAAGRWIPSDPKQKGSSPSETEIDCYRQSRICVEATAESYSGHPHVSLAYLEVVRWDENGIVATSPSAICMTEAVLISSLIEVFPPPTQ